jgi:predicted TIM-barrel fold metal-dependent hydrolase
MDLNHYKPISKLTIPQHHISRPRFPVVDAHNHLDGLFSKLSNEPISSILDRLDEVDIRVYVDLDGGWGEDILHRHLDRYKAAAPERFLVFGGVDWSKWPEHGDRFGEWAAARLRAQVARGAQGLKIWKPFGLHVRDHHGALVKVNDRRLDPVWETAAELHLPVLIHVADPVAFFDPVNERNERWEELQGNPNWAFTSPPFPPFLSILEDFAALVQDHPRTTFIGAHVGCYAENLAWVASLLEHCPNLSIDISARIGELGRQPYTARRFFIQYANRILFGTDIGPDPESTRIYYRFLETEDEYFNYNTGDIPGQGRWQIYGLGLPDDVLKKVYSTNAMQLLGLNNLP